MRADLKELFHNISETYGTPTYVYFHEIIEENIQKVKDVFKGINTLTTFACKANNNPRLLKIFKENEFGVDIVSKGELLASKLAGIEREKIVWNGNGKSLADMEKLSNEVMYINIDSVEELKRWEEISPDNCEFFLRINPDVDPKTHPHISTGLKKNKFGIPVEKVEKILTEKRKIKISGFHLHIGSQITDVEPFKEAFEQVVELSKKYGFSKINIGGGWGIDYNGEKLDLSKYKETVVPLLKDFELVILELGRFLIAPAGFLIFKVELVKETEDKTFVVLDGGMNDLIRPAMYDAFHRIFVLESTGKKGIVDFVGPLCESGDYIALERESEIPKEGSIIAVENVGAYGYSMSSNYNSFGRPAEILVRNGTYELIRRREREEEIFKNVII